MRNLLVHMRVHGHSGTGFYSPVHKGHSTGMNAPCGIAFDDFFGYKTIKFYKWHGCELNAKDKRSSKSLRHKIYACVVKRFMKRKLNQNNRGRHEHPLPNEISREQKVQNKDAQEEAMHDIEKDPDLSIHSPNDDLDEGETARLGEDQTDLV